MPLPCCRSDSGEDMPSLSGHTPATPSTVALRRLRGRHQPANIFQLGEVAHCPATVLKSCLKAAVDPVGFASDILAYSFSVIVASVIFYVASIIFCIAVQFAKGSIANLAVA